MFHFDNTDPSHGERIRAIHEELEKKLEKIGCYVRNTAFQQPVDEDGHPTGDPFLMIECQIGSVAWSPRVQEPEQDKTNDEFRGIAGDLAEEQFEEIRRQEKERRDRARSGIPEIPEEGQEGEG